MDFTIPTRAEISAARKIARRYGVRSLLSDIGADPKTAKSNKLGKYLTAIQYLAPADMSGTNLCSHASPGCISGCLFTAGNPIHLQGKTKARLARTRFYLEERSAYKIVLYAEILNHVKRCAKLELKPAVRLNGTSDIVWERIFPELFRIFSDVQWYDYTKIPKRMMRGWERPKNYFLAFSRSETNQADCETILQDNPRSKIAVVFSPYRTQPLPKTYKGCKVINGDAHDLIFQHKGARVIGLRAKGEARTDTSGFVVQV